MLICPVARPVTISSRLRHEGWDVALPFTQQSSLSRPSHQIVRSARDRRIARSAVSRGSPSTKAVAPIIRSTGSLGYDAGRPTARTHARPLIGRIMNRASTSRKKDSRRMSRRMRLLFERVANSSKVMSEMANPSPFRRASLMAEPVHTEQD